MADDALWLAEVIADALPGEAEAHGLVALLSFHRSREPARSLGGELVLLADQDRTQWDDLLRARGRRALDRAATLKRPGRWQLQAAIAACHADAPRMADTDWRQIVVLYDMLRAVDPSPVVRLNRAVALAETGDATGALAEVEALQEALGGFHLWHAVRAHLLRRLGRALEAVAADERARSLTRNDAERRLLDAREVL
jgi:RNA polymerase sigma-70 factor (ECF subfamily)